MPKTNQKIAPKDVKKAVTTTKKAVGTAKKIDRITKKSGVKLAMPYIFIFVGLLLALCYIMVLLFGESGAGMLGFYIQYGLCWMFGGAAFFLPLVLCYCGVLQCIFDMKWRHNSRKKHEEEAIRASKRKKTTRISLAATLFLLFSTLLGIWSAEDSYDFLELGSKGAESFLSGGTVGGSLGFLFYFALEKIIPSVIIIIVFIIIFAILIGITPSRIAARIECRQEVRDDGADPEQVRYEKMRAKEVALAEKKKQKQLDSQEKKAAKREAERETREQQEIYEDETPARAPRKRTAPKTKEMPEDIYDEDESREADEDTKAFEEPPMKPIELDSDKSDKRETKKQSDGLMDYGGDPTIDAEAYNKAEADIGEAEEIPEEAAPEVNTAAKKTSAASAKKNVEEEKEIELGEISKDALSEDLSGVAPDDGYDLKEEASLPYIFPPLDMLAPNDNPTDADCQAELQENAKILKDTLKSFRVEIKEINYSRGPTITRYELKPEVGTRVKSIANLVDDIALSLATTGVRIEAPIPNKAAVGIEVPNRNRAKVYLRDLVENNKFTDAKSKLTSCLGMDVGGNPVYFDIGKMPHLLIAGTTGSGKSVCINTIILSIIYKARPDEVKLILVDPKQVEFTVYENIPHLYCPIVSEPKKAAGALASAVAEMERRFELIKEVGVRNIEAYNEVTANDPEKEYLPKMVIVIDELADLMMTARDEVETSICRLAQKARAAGIHVILGTQRPSVDVITGLIKANIPSRIACTVTSQVDSRTIIDVAGAENLIGYGDMLFAPVGASKPMRVQGAFVSDGEVEQIVDFIKTNNGTAKYNSAFITSMEENAKMCGAGKKGASGGDFEPSDDSDGGDSKFRDAVKLAIEQGKISTSLMQRKLGIGYGRAAKIIDTMEEMGYVSKPDGNKPRQVLITMEEFMNRVSDGSLGEE